MIELKLLSTDEVSAYQKAACDGLLNSIESAMLGHIAAQDAEIARLSAELDQAYQAGATVIAERDRLQAAAVETTVRILSTQDQEIADACATVAAYAARQMPRETSASIAAWQNETFGPATTSVARVARSWSMMYEAFDSVRFRCDLSVPRPNLSRAIRAAEELAELIELLVVNDSDPKAPREVADIDIVLRGIDAAHGVEHVVQVDEKMAVNRERRWHVTGDGHGQHVEESTSAGDGQ